MPKDYYAILGISPDANASQIKKAFRERARLLHPDVNDSADALGQFQELQQAYEVLKDPEQRSLYDQGELVYTPEPPPPAPVTDYRRRAWNTFNKYDPEYGYVDTDYGHYRLLNTVIGIVTFLFASTFLVDYLFSWEADNQQVLEVISKSQLTQNIEDLGYVVVSTDNLQFEKPSETPELLRGELIDIEKSVIYGFMRYRRVGESTFNPIIEGTAIIHVLAVIVYIASLSAIFNKKHPERKFNAGIIAGFFSIMLLFFALFA